MNQETIPDNNLPVYLQQYDVNILNVDLPKCLIGGCQGTKGVPNVSLGDRCSVFSGGW